jgi:hypothetical protein
VGSTICVILLVLSILSIFLPVILNWIAAMGRNARADD